MTTITWTKCSEALPDDDESVLIACDDGEVQVGFLDAGTWRYQDAMPLELHGVSVTHWADLPAHPDDQRARLPDVRPICPLPRRALLPSMHESWSLGLHQRQRIPARRPGATVRNGGSMKTELDSAWESAIHNAERARKAEAEIERLQAELAEAKKFKDGMLDVLGGACPKDHRATPFDDFKGCTPCLRAELATEHKRQSAMRTLIASLEGQLMHYRSKQAEADEAVRTLDSERAANATLTAELAECKEDAERWRYLRDDGCGFEITVREENEDGYESWVSGYPGAELDAAIDAARKGEGE